MHARLANLKYDPGDVGNEDVHFTCAMDDFEWDRMTPEQIRFEAASQGVEWMPVQEEVQKALGELFLGAGHEIGAWPLSRALYGVDIMIQRDLSPVILEVNFCPDMRWPIHYYDGFLDTVYT